MARVGIVVTIPASYYETIAGIKRIKEGINEVLEKHRPSVEAKVKALAPRDTGRLSDAIVVQVLTEGGGSFGLMITAKATGKRPTPRQYFFQREFGGQIVGKGKQLAWPMPEFKGLVGSASEVFRNPKQFGFESMFVKGGTILGKRADDSVEPVFVLRRSVMQDGTLFATNTLRRHKPAIMRSLWQLAKTGKVGG